MIKTVPNRIMPKGKVILPPSKSEAIRAALLFALAGEDASLAAAGYEPPYCADVLCAIGASKADVPFVGESAALMRMLVPIRLALAGEARIGADARLIMRGIGELEDCLGARAVRTEDGLAITKKLVPGRFFIDCSRSSQFLSGLLIALPLLGGDCEIVIRNGLVSKPYADMTFDMARLFGGQIERTETGFITHTSDYRAPEGFRAAGDLSYAAVFEAMNLLGGEVEIIGKTGNTRQPDAAFLRLVDICECDITDCPDLLPLLAVAACGRTGESVFRGTARLKTKESDRENGTAGLINSLGGEARVTDGGLVVRGTGALHGGTAEIQSDHRLAFAAACAALICDSPVTIPDADCVDKSAPCFWRDLKRLSERSERAGWPVGD